MTYADLKQVKQRTNIPDTKSTHDEKLAGYMSEADGYINNQISLHATVPVANPDTELISRGSSLAASMYNYWVTPAKERTLDGINHWEQKIQDHILAVYGKRNPSGLTGTKFGKTSSAIKGTEA